MPEPEPEPGPDASSILDKIEVGKVRVSVWRACVAMTQGGDVSPADVLRAAWKRAGDAAKSLGNRGKSSDRVALFVSIVREPDNAKSLLREAEKAHAVREAATPAPVVPTQVSGGDDVRKDEQRRAAACDAIDAADEAALSAAWLAALNSGKVFAAMVARCRKMKTGTLEELRASAKHRFVCEVVAECLKGGSA